jgi:hypothetical protein
VAVKVALLKPAGTETVAGTVSAVRLLDNETGEPPEAAAFDKVTVQLDVPLELRLVGVHDTRFTTVGDNNEMDVFWVTPLYVAVMTAN